MSPDRFPGRDLRLERLSERDGVPSANYGEIAHTGSHSTGANQFQATYEALIDAVFLAPGAAEWLRALGVAVAAMVARKETPPHEPVAKDAIRLADPGPRRG
jgi:hypothetical protein